MLLVKPRQRGRVGALCHVLGGPCAGGTDCALVIFTCQASAKPPEAERGGSGLMPASHRLDHEHPQPSTRADGSRPEKSLCLRLALSLPHVVGLHQSAREQLVLRQRLATQPSPPPTDRPAIVFTYSLWNCYPTAVINPHAHTHAHAFPPHILPDQQSAPRGWPSEAPPSSRC